MLAIYEDDGEWYDATVEAVLSDGWIEVSFDEYDDGETYVPPENVEARADDGGDDDDGRGGRGRRRGARRGCAAAGDRQPVRRAAGGAADRRAPRRILGALERSQAVVLEGETGSGKSTQAPQFVLEHAAERGLPCNIIVTQPRRSRRSASPNASPPSAARCRAARLGYSIRLESKARRRRRSSARRAS